MPGERADWDTKTFQSGLGAQFIRVKDSTLDMTPSKTHSMIGFWTAKRKTWWLLTRKLHLIKFLTQEMLKQKFLKKSNFNGKRSEKLSWILMLKKLVKFLKRNSDFTSIFGVWISVNKFSNKFSQNLILMEMAWSLIRTSKLVLDQRCSQLKVSTSDKTSSKSASKLTANMKSAGSQPKMAKTSACCIKKCTRTSLSTSLQKSLRKLTSVGKNLCRT